MFARACAGVRVGVRSLTSNEVGTKGRSNKMAIADAGGIVPLVDLATSGTVEQREAAVGALWNLAFNDANKKAIAAAGGIPPLVDLVRNGTPRQKEQAASALANLTVDEDNRSRVVGAGGISALVPLMNGGETERQRSFAHACIRNLAIDAAIRQKIELAVSSGAETARSKALVDACRKNVYLGDDAAAVEERLEQLALGGGGENAPPAVAAAKTVDVE